MEDDTIPILREQKKQQAKNRLLFGKDYKDYNLVFSRPDGRPVMPEYFHRHFDKIRTLSAIYLRIHDMRHTHITRLIEERVPIKIIQERSGHADITTLLNTYAHVLQGAQQEVLKGVSVL